MKTTFLAVAVLLGSACAAQIGVITLPKRAKEVPVGQWYTVQDKHHQNNVLFYAEKDVVFAKLYQMLEDEGLFFEQFELDEQNAKYWTAEKENGFTSFIYLIPDDGTYFWINVVTPFE
ncbi:MAG: hypothetical protein ACK45H_12050 [Bacteroidota bacterium]|jgi:hypothetical protein